MTEFTMDRLRENLEALKMKNTLEILDNYLERAVADKLNRMLIIDEIGYLPMDIQGANLFFRLIARDPIKIRVNDKL